MRHGYKGNGEPGACMRSGGDDMTFVTVDVARVTQAIKKKNNWSSPGPDGILNYWIKKITSLHKPLAKIIELVINENGPPPEWLNMAGTNHAFSQRR